VTNEALTVQLLGWIGPAPRNYAETMEAWRTSCPRLTVWEDALSAGLIERVPGASLREARVRVTAEGDAYLRLRDTPAAPTARTRPRRAYRPGLSLLSAAKGDSAGSPSPS
jgi:hypothetical protein